MRFAIGDHHSIAHGAGFFWFELPSGLLNGDIVEKDFAIGPNAHALGSITIVRVT